MQPSEGPPMGQQRKPLMVLTNAFEPPAAVASWPVLAQTPTRAVAPRGRKSPEVQRRGRKSPKAIRFDRLARRGETSNTGPVPQSAVAQLATQPAKTAGAVESPPGQAGQGRVNDQLRPAAQRSDGNAIQALVQSWDEQESHLGVKGPMETPSRPDKGEAAPTPSRAAIAKGGVRRTVNQLSEPSPAGAKSPPRRRRSLPTPSLGTVVEESAEDAAAAAAAAQRQQPSAAPEPLAPARRPSVPPPRRPVVSPLRPRVRRNSPLSQTMCAVKAATALPPPPPKQQNSRRPKLTLARPLSPDEEPGSAGRLRRRATWSGPPTVAMELDPSVEPADAPPQADEPHGMPTPPPTPPQADAGAVPPQSASTWRGWALQWTVSLIGLAIYVALALCSRAGLGDALLKQLRLIAGTDHPTAGKDMLDPAIGRLLARQRTRTARMASAAQQPPTAIATPVSTSTPKRPAASSRTSPRRSDADGSPTDLLSASSLPPRTRSATSWWGNAATPGYMDAIHWTKPTEW
mmetsp:Transcript_21993/g.65942  ORF Transcript_21993/g.65942 Transcript_21993/m.65942 type:complete len:517 (-) Transcript_21993:4067-5617(-)